MSDAKIRPDGYIHERHVTEGFPSATAQVIPLHPNDNHSKSFLPYNLLPTSELEEVVEKLKNVEMQAAIQSSGWARMMSDELLSIITRLSTGRMDGGGEG